VPFSLWAFKLFASQVVDLTKYLEFQHAAPKPPGVSPGNFHRGKASQTPKVYLRYYAPLKLQWLLNISSAMQ